MTLLNKSNLQQSKCLQGQHASAARRIWTHLQMEVQGECLVPTRADGTAKEDLGPSYS